MSRDIDKILRSDDLYMLTRQGDEVLLEFDSPPPLEDGWTRRVSLKAEGYYIFHLSFRAGRR